MRGLFPWQVQGLHRLSTPVTQTNIINLLASLFACFRLIRLDKPKALLQFIQQNLALFALENLNKEIPPQL